MALKWKREKPGTYLSTNGRWKIVGEGNMWRLFDRHDDDDEVVLTKRKSVCQDKAEEVEASGDKYREPTSGGKNPPPSRKPPPRRPGKPVKPSETRAEAIDRSIENGTLSVSSTLSSLYLEISGLRFSLERTLTSIKHVENALQRVVDPEGKIPRAGQS